MAKVLYIACSQERSQTVSRTLTHLPGIEFVCYAADGFEAITLATLLKPDVVMLDAALEKLNGAEVARALQSEYSSHSSQKAPHILVVDERIGHSELLAAVGISAL